MTAFPAAIPLAPIEAWPKLLTPAGERRPSPFDSTLSATVELLGREVDKLGAVHWDMVTLRVAVPAGLENWRRDGRPRAGAPIEHPGLILEVEATIGTLTFACDRFQKWPDNLRALALAIEALRKVDRYDVTSGQQYQSFLAIESGIALGPSSIRDTAHALSIIGKAAGGYDVALNPAAIADALRAGKRKLHPDVGGDPAEFDLLMKAEAHLRDMGQIK